MLMARLSEPPNLGSAEGDLLRFVPISPFSSDLFRFSLLVFGNAPICSDLDLLRFLPICSDLFSEQIRTNQGNPFLPTPFTNPRDYIMRCAKGFFAKGIWGCTEFSQRKGGNLVHPRILLAKIPLAQQIRISQLRMLCRMSGEKIVERQRGNGKRGKSR